jgi:anaphase-promoting complex subunit 5
MTRYLTPAKIGLLALMDLYCSDAVPNDATLPVLSFISAQLIDNLASSNSSVPSERWQKGENTIQLVVSISDFDTLLSPHGAAIGLPGRRLWDVFLQKLWGIDSIDALHAFFHELPSHLAKTKEELRKMAEEGEEPPSEDTILLSRNSPFGTFIRRATLEFTRLPFHDVSRLWKDFIRYRQPTATYWQRRNPGFGQLSFDQVLATGQHEWADKTGDVVAVTYSEMLLDTGRSGPHLVSTDDVEVLLEFQIEQMQSKILLNFRTLLQLTRI